MLNPLCVNECTPYDGDATCSACSASYRHNYIGVLERGEILLQNGILHPFVF